MSKENDSFRKYKPKSQKNNKTYKLSNSSIKDENINTYKKIK